MTYRQNLLYYSLGLILAVGCAFAFFLIAGDTSWSSRFVPALLFAGIASLIAVPIQLGVLFLFRLAWRRSRVSLHNQIAIANLPLLLVMAGLLAYQIASTRPRVR